MPKVIRPKKILTFSALSLYRACPRKYKHRYEDCLKASGNESRLALRFGQVIHEALTLWYSGGGDLEKVYRLIDSLFPEFRTDTKQKHHRLLACAMMAGYAQRYPKENWNIVALDLEFEGVIRNPRTGCQSRTFKMAGKANGLVEVDGETWLLENRTVGTSEEVTPEHLWTDTRSALYCDYLRKEGYPVVGVIYNILVKSRIEQKQGETELEFEQRKSELLAKSKTGKTTAQRQMPESDDEYLARLEQWYQKEGAFERVFLRIPEERLPLLREEIWEMTQQYLGSRRRDSWLLNTENCFHFGQPCEYLKYCQSGFNPEICELLYQIVPPHEELPVLGLNLRPEEQKRYEEVRRDRVNGTTVNVN